MRRRYASTAYTSASTASHEPGSRPPHAPRAPPTAAQSCRAARISSAAIAPRPHSARESPHSSDSTAAQICSQVDPNVWAGDSRSDSLGIEPWHTSLIVVISMPPPYLGASHVPIAAATQTQHAHRIRCTRAFRLAHHRFRCRRRRPAVDRHPGSHRTSPRPSATAAESAKQPHRACAFALTSGAAVTASSVRVDRSRRRFTATQALPATRRSLCYSAHCSPTVASLRPKAVAALGAPRRCSPS